ncbi:MAG: hypothetical protein H0T76_07945 [Nannocystis sp.]|nr:hypothetical protein [Nannocystis sp.]MBA3546397.1 hypothetical protein [Nannocystis sp.]
MVRSVSLASLLALAACPGESNDDTGGATASTTANASSSSTAAEPTSSTAAADTTDTTTAAADACPDRPSGAYNACESNGFTDNKLCGWTSDGGPQSVTCLSPQSGGFNICGLRDCVDDCDCFAPPTTGTAIPGCQAIFGDGGKACVLYCLNGQLCPDGMECAGGYCYWPN